MRDDECGGPGSYAYRDARAIVSGGRIEVDLGPLAGRVFDRLAREAGKNQHDLVLDLIWSWIKAHDRDGAIRRQTAYALRSELDSAVNLDDPEVLTLRREVLSVLIDPLAAAERVAREVAWNGFLSSGQMMSETDVLRLRDCLVIDGLADEGGHKG